MQSIAMKCAQLVGKLINTALRYYDNCHREAREESRRDVLNTCLKESAAGYPFHVKHSAALEIFSSFLLFDEEELCFALNCMKAAKLFPFSVFIAFGTYLKHFHPHYYHVMQCIQCSYFKLS